MRRTSTMLAFAVSFAAGPALAEEASRPEPAPEADPRPPSCASYEVHARFLAERYGEVPAFTGSLNERVLLRVFVNHATGSWTALMVRSDGTSCVTGAGENGRQDRGL